MFYLKSARVFNATDWNTHYVVQGKIDDKKIPIQLVPKFLREILKRSCSIETRNKTSRVIIVEHSYNSSVRCVTKLQGFWYPLIGSECLDIQSQIEAGNSMRRAKRQVSKNERTKIKTNDCWCFFFVFCFYSYYLEFY
mgnify:CR=1 FL=1